MTYPAQQREAAAKEAMVETFIKEFRADNQGISPTVREIGDSFGWQPSTVQKVIGRLHRAGRVNRQFGKPRGVSA
jgi:DNA-binding MarR family transcriptional regulator